MSKPFKIAAFFLISFLAFVPQARAQLTVYKPVQGGTGTSTWQTNSIPYFNGTRFTENTGFNWNNTLSRLTATYASTTAFTVSGSPFLTGIASSSVLFTKAGGEVTGSSNLTYDGTALSLGSSANLATLKSSISLTDPSSGYAQVAADGTYISQTGAIANLYGFLSQPVFNPTGSGTVTQAVGAFWKPYANLQKATAATVGISTIRAMRMNVAVNGASPTGRITTVIGLDLFPLNGEQSGTAAMQVGQIYGLNIGNQGTVTGTATGITMGGAMGISIAEQSGGTSNTLLGLGSNAFDGTDYSIYNVSTKKNTHAGKTFMGGTGTATAYLHLAAGTATAATAPLKFTSGTLLATPEAGTIEYLSNRFYLRGSDGLSVAGNVGIGTTTPNWKLQVAGTNPSLALSDTGASANQKHWLISSGGGKLSIGTSTDAYATSSPAIITITSTGALGVGTANPTFSRGIELANPSGSNLIFSGNNGVIANIATAGLQIGTVGTSVSSGGIRFVIGSAAATYGSTGEIARVASTGFGSGTTTPWGQLSASTTSSTAPALAVEQKGSGPSAIFLGGSVGIGTTTPTTQLHVTASGANATSTVTVGKVGQNKGSCLELFDAAGVAQYISVQGGALVVSSTSCK